MGHQKQIVIDLSSNLTPPQRKCSSVTFSNNTRFIVLLLSTVALTLTVSNGLALNFTIICMKKEPSTQQIEYTNANTTTQQPQYDPDALYSLNERSILFSAPALGMLMGNILIVYFTSKFGFRKTFVAFGLISAFATLFTPLAVYIHVGLVVLMRVLQGYYPYPFFAMDYIPGVHGLAQSTSLVAMAAITAEWSPQKRSGTYLSWISCHLQFGPIFTMPVAGTLCETVGWPSVYYLQGSLSVIVFVCFFIFFRDSPRFQKNVSTHELTKIEEGKLKIRTDKSEQQVVPYKAIGTDPMVWAALSSLTLGTIAYCFSAQFGPVYMNKALHINVENTGFASAFPFILAAIVKIIGGPFSDHITCLSEKTRVIMFGCLSQFIMSGCFIAISFLPGNQVMLIQLFFTISVASNSMNSFGVVKAAQLMSQHFCHVIMSWVGIISSIMALVMPFIVGLTVTENTPQQWSRIFLGIAVLTILVNLYFALTIEVEPRPWSIPEDSKSSTSDIVDNDDAKESTNKVNYSLNQQQIP